MQLIHVPVAHGLPVVQDVCWERRKWTEYLRFLEMAGGGGLQAELIDVAGHWAWTTVPDKGGTFNDFNKSMKASIYTGNITGFKSTWRAQTSAQQVSRDLERHQSAILWPATISRKFH